MKPQIDEVVLQGGVPFAVRVGSPVQVVLKGVTTLTKVTRIMGGPGHGYFVEVEHERMRFNCKDAHRRGYPLGCGHLLSVEWPRIEGTPVPSGNGRPEGAIVRPLDVRAPRETAPKDPAALERARLEAKLIAVRWDKVAADPGLAQVILDVAQAGLSGDHVSRRGDAWKFTVEVEHADPGR